MPNDEGEFGSFFGDVDIHDNDDLLFVAHYAARGTVQGRQGLIHLPGGEVTEKGSVVISTADLIPEAGRLYHRPRIGGYARQRKFRGSSLRNVTGDECPSAGCSCRRADRHGCRLHADQRQREGSLQQKSPEHRFFHTGKKDDCRPARFYLRQHQIRPEDRQFEQCCLCRSCERIANAS